MFALGRCVVRCYRMSIQSLLDPKFLLQLPLLFIVQISIPSGSKSTKNEVRLPENDLPKMTKEKQLSSETPQFRI